MFDMPDEGLATRRGAGRAAGRARGAELVGLARAESLRASMGLMFSFSTIIGIANANDIPQITAKIIRSSETTMITARYPPAIARLPSSERP